MDGVGMGRGGSKKCKPIPAPPRSAGLKSCPITFAGRGKIAIPTLKEVLRVEEKKS